MRGFSHGGKIYLKSILVNNFNGMVSPVNSEHIPSDINFNLWGPVFLGHPVDTTIYTNDETFIKRQNMDSNAPDEK